MLAVIGFSLTCIAIMMFESVRVLKDLPGASSWLNGVARSSTGVIVIMAFFMTGLSLIARFALDIETHTFGPIEGVAVLAILIVTVMWLRALYARRKRLLVPTEVAGDGVVVPLDLVAPPAEIESDRATIPGSPSTGVSRGSKGSKNAA